MASIRKRGDTYTITGYLGYAADGKQIKKTTTYRPPPGVTNGKAEKLAREFAITWEQKIRGFTALDENRTFEELAEWYYSNVAPSTLKEHTLIGGNINLKLKRLVAAAGLPPDIHLHSLRHTHASLLINSDVTAKVIASRLGHGTTKTTLDTYAHVFASSEVKVMQAVQMALFDGEE